MSCDSRYEQEIDSCIREETQDLISMLPRLASRQCKIFRTLVKLVKRNPMSPACCRESVLP